MASVFLFFFSMRRVKEIAQQCHNSHSKKLSKQSLSPDTPVWLSRSFVHPAAGSFYPTLKTCGPLQAEDKSNKKRQRPT